MDETQLKLPNVGDEPIGGPLSALRRDRRVYVNRSLRMETAEWVGFDMDYTLAIYKQEEIDKLSIEATVKKMVDRGYPPFLAEARFDPGFAIRGLLIDKKLGHVLKMDRYRYVGRAYHGMKELDREVRHALYETRKVRLVGGRYHWIDTLYALPEAAVYAGAVDVLDAYGVHVDYQQLFDDIRECIDEAHRDGSIVDVIANDLPRFVEKDPLLASTLHKLRSSGKKLFLLTNSRWGYTDRMMKFLLHGAMPEYASWRQYFDVVSVAAGKPTFFTDKRPFLERTVDGPVETTNPAYTMERGRVYEQGNLKDFERMIRAYGDAIVYVGDHIFGDILRSKKDSSWRTVLVVQEMDWEMEAMARTHDEVALIDSLARRRDMLEDELRIYQARYRVATRKGKVDEGAASEARRAIEGLKGALRAQELRARQMSRSVQTVFHPYWGSLFKQGAELSSFGDQVEHYACLYTSRVSNLANYSPMHYFRSPRDLMPHEMG